jgi:hypothetical protein
MTESVRDLPRILARARTRCIRATLVRCVPQIDFMENNPPVYLFASTEERRHAAPGDWPGVKSAIENQCHSVSF